MLNVEAPKIFITIPVAVAQMVEHSTTNHEVKSSSHRNLIIHRMLIGS